MNKSENDPINPISSINIDNVINETNSRNNKLKFIKETVMKKILN